jgi:hypothetical protein
MYSEHLNQKSGRFEKNSESVSNHLLDCMCEALVLALMAKCYIPEASMEEVMPKSPALQPANK